MNKYGYIGLLLIGLVGCQSTSTEYVPEYTTDIIEVEPEELSNYWVRNPSRVINSTKVRTSTRVRRERGRPKWLPADGPGEWTVLTVIDSNGNEVERTFISSNPEGFMNQEKVDLMPKRTFVPAETNDSRIPVKFIGTNKISAIKRRRIY